jgi:RNA polymerase sigma factor (sigma-70 family)
LPTLVGFLLVQGARFTEAADIAQETMTRAYKLWATIDHPKAWARTVASRALARNIARIPEDPREEIAEETLLVPSSINVTEWEEHHEILRVLSLLPPRQRQVLAWTFDGYSPAEIGEILGISSETVRANLLKARRALAGHLGSGKDER